MHVKVDGKIYSANEHLIMLHLGMDEVETIKQMEPCGCGGCGIMVFAPEWLRGELIDKRAESFFDELEAMEEDSRAKRKAAKRHMD